MYQCKLECKLRHANCGNGALHAMYALHRFSQLVIYARARALASAYVPYSKSASVSLRASPDRPIPVPAVPTSTGSGTGAGTGSGTGACPVPCLWQSVSSKCVCFKVRLLSPF